jgi:hypothetical protein
LVAAAIVLVVAVADIALVAAVGTVAEATAAAAGKLRQHDGAGYLTAAWI